MEEKKEIKIGLSAVFLIISIIIIIIMGYFLYKLNFHNIDMAKYEKDLNDKISKLEEIKKESESDYSNRQKEAEVYKTSKRSFSEIMDMIYTKNDTIIDGNKIYINTYSSTNNIIYDEKGKITNVGYVDIRNMDGEIFFNMNNVENNKEISTTITGITEDVVSIKIILEESCAPKIIYFLTRNGNIYYVNQKMMNSNNFVAEQVTTLKEIISIEVASVLYPGDMEGTSTLIATNYEGEKINFSDR